VVVQLGGNCTGWDISHTPQALAEKASARGGVLRPSFVGRQGLWRPAVHRQAELTAMVPVRPSNTRQKLVNFS
jgi:hypothetical protein